ncbi:MAG: tRNA (adenosine(37)-N6)-threonylcarbamoyltransferase complex transferase subunit TsaD [Clostridiales bacterium]|nr:tRNA (adenosine(37)-N6)-threonylcarbamoyltransferase complex transferase subunit TsaD [Clostridiales bacterium]
MRRRSADILAIESSCDETSAAVVRDGRTILSLKIASQIDIHVRYGGVVPEIASRMHMEAIDALVDAAVDEAGTTLCDVSAIAVTVGPGLVGALLVGVSHAKAMAWALRKPLVGVHHIEGHIASNYIAHPDLVPPFLCLIVSGGHTLLADVTDYGRYRVLGSTRDDAAGEAFDKGARILGLPYPGGVQIDRLARQGDPAAFDFPRAKLGEDALDFSFSGVKTALMQFVRKQPEGFAQEHIHDLAASYQQAIVDALVDRTAAACRAGGRSTVVLAGGVAANSRLRECLANALPTGTVLRYPPVSLCADNAAMIASAAWYRLMEGETAGLDINASPGLPFAET